MRVIFPDLRVSSGSPHLPSPRKSLGCGSSARSGSASPPDVPGDPVRRRPAADRQTTPAILTGLGCLLRQYCRPRSVRYSGQHTTRWHEADRQLVSITASHHPLCGQTLAVVRRLHKQGEPHLVVRLPSGASQLIPARWTARSSPGVPDSAPERADSALWSLSSVRAVVRIVGALRDRSSLQQEVGNAAVNEAPISDSHALPAVGDLPAPDTPHSGESVDRSARPPGSGAATDPRARPRHRSAQPIPPDFR